MNYLFGKRKTRLFELVLICATIILSITLIRNTTSFFSKGSYLSTTQVTLKPGWNFLSVPYSGDSAESWCNQYSFTEVARLVGNKWERYVCLSPEVTNFPIAAHQPYFVNQGNDDLTVFFNAKGNVSTQRFNNGWNSFLLNGRKYSQASDICRTSPSKNFSVTRVSRWAFGRWNEHNCGESLNDFPVFENNTYFIYFGSPSAEGSSDTPQLLTSPE